MHLQREFHEDLWHYQFHTLLPNDQGRISTPNYLRSNLPYLVGYQFIDHKRKIKSIQAELNSAPSGDPGIDLEEFIALQYLSDRMETL